MCLRALVRACMCVGLKVVNYLICLRCLFVEAESESEEESSEEEEEVRNDELLSE